MRACGPSYGEVLPAEAHMNVHVSYKAGKTPDLEREFQHQLQKLERRLQIFKPDLVHLHAIIEKQNTHSLCASLNLRLPSGQMAAQRSGENAMAAVRSAFSDLVSQVTKHKDILRGHLARKSRRREGLGRVTEEPVPLEIAMPSIAAARLTAEAQNTVAKTD